MNKLANHAYIFLTIGLTVYSQIIMRWQMSKLGAAPDVMLDKVQFVLAALLRPWILTAVVATFFSGLSWMLALNKFEMSYAFPFMALNFLLVMLAGAAFFGEEITTGKIMGNLLIVAGVVLLARAQA